MNHVGRKCTILSVLVLVLRFCGLASLFVKDILLSLQSISRQCNALPNAHDKDLHLACNYGACELHR